VRLARRLARALGATTADAGDVAWAAAADAADGALVESAGAGDRRPRPAAVDAILAQRHERVDGAGTPQGLVGDEIALGARIVQVAAAFEEGVNGGAGTAQARAGLIEDLRRRAGSEFDPCVVETLVQLGVEEGWLDRGWAPGPSDAAEAA
jgi:hypothetical protein